MGTGEISLVICVMSVCFAAVIVIAHALQLVSALGQKQTSRHIRFMCVIPLKADIRQREWHVRCYIPCSHTSRLSALNHLNWTLAT